MSNEIGYIENQLTTSNNQRLENENRENGEEKMMKSNLREFSKTYIKKKNPHN